MSFSKPLHLMLIRSLSLASPPTFFCLLDFIVRFKWFAWKPRIFYYDEIERVYMDDACRHLFENLHRKKYSLFYRILLWAFFSRLIRKTLKKFRRKNGIQTLQNTGIQFFGDKWCDEIDVYDQFAIKVSQFPTKLTWSFP